MWTLSILAPSSVCVDQALTDDVDFGSDRRLLPVGGVGHALVVAGIVFVDAVEAQVRNGLA